ncbi:MAG: autotransporter domain-containing protein [Hyphomicrobiales bacterium]
MSRFLRRGAHLCASGFSASAAHVSFTTYRSIFAARFVFASFILIASLIGPQPTYAVDYVVTGLNTATNGNGNPDPITGVGDTLTLTNGSSITASNAEGIHFNNAGQSTISNLGSIDTIGASAFGIWNQTSANSTISNSGSILTTSVGAHGIYNDDSADSTISNRGAILTTHQDAFGIHNTNSARSTISNSGSISTAGSFALLPSASYGIFNDTSANSTISNSGSISTIRETAHGIVNLTSAGSMISNSGSISTTNGRAAGIFNLSSAGSTISNSGAISTEHFDAFGILNQSSANTTISNSGSISTMGNSAHGIYNEASTGNTIRNSGSIRVDHSNSIGIRSDTAINLINSGLVFAASTASSAIELNSGNDILTLSAGSRIKGLIGMNNGDDTITLDHGGNDISWRWTFEHFKDASSDVLSVIGAPYVVEDAGLSNGGNGITVTVADQSREANAGAVLADLIGAVTGAVTSRIAEAWALSDTGLSTGAEMTDEDGSSLGWNAWAKAFGGFQDRGSQSGAGGLSPDTRHAFGGVVVGADTAPTNGALFGAFGGFAVSKLSFADASLNDTSATDIDTNTLFGGIYGRIASAHGLFADGTLSVGYADGDADKRLQANNLATGGIEEITGGDASGFYAASSVTFGAHVPVGTSSAVFIPSATFGYATQWRKGYTEDASVDGAMSVEDYMASILTARLQLATQMSRSTASGMGWTAAFRGGVDLQKDISQDVEFTMLSTALSADAGPDDTQLGGFLGLNLAIAQSDTIAFTLDGEMTFAGHNADEVGGSLNAGIRARF